MYWKKTIFSFLIIWIYTNKSICTGASVLDPPANLRCEYRTTPIDIDISHPRLFWEVKSGYRGAEQSAYQVLVAGSYERLDQNEADIWDSGKVNSSQSIQIAFNGKTLTSGTRYYWKVRTWNQFGKPSDYSRITYWETGLLEAQDWKGSWIGDGEAPPLEDSLMYGDIPAPLFRKEFLVKKKIEKAKLYVSGLGYFEAYINGVKISSDMLSPGWTAYNKRIQYLTYDVTGELGQKENVVGIILGNGWYNPLPLPLFNRLNLRNILTIGQPKFILQLSITFKDGTDTLVVSDENWKTSKGPILKNNVYLGEVYDARLEQSGWNEDSFDDSNWKKSVKADPPGGKLEAQIQPPVRITKILQPVALTEPEKGVFIFDMGQNFAGCARLHVQGPAGTRVQLRYGELLNEDGTLNWKTTVACHIMEGWYVQHRPGMPKNALQSSVYILKGTGEEVYNPRFTFHGFRYVEVTGFPGTPTLASLQGLRMNSDLDQTGEFTCSNELFNKIHQNTLWTFLSNVFSIESDCPGREKFGYGGDIVTASEAFMQNYDMSTFYTKTVHDFQDGARPGGGMPECAPDNAVYDNGISPDTGPIGWMYAYPWVQEKLYRYYGDKKLIEEQYESTRRLIEFIRSHAQNNLVMPGLGDHGSLERRGIATVANGNSPVTSTAFYYDHVRQLAFFAGLLNKNEDAEKYAQLAREIKKSFIDQYYDFKSGKIAEGLQAYQSMALYYDLLPENEIKPALDVLINDIMVNRKGHLATGIFGTKMMFDVLRNYNQNDVAFTMNDQMTFPGYGAMIADGATTIYESWQPEGGGSKNHPMFGSIDEWFFKSVLGIVHHPEAQGFDRIIVKPFIVGDLQWAKGYYQSIRGRIGSEWKLQGDELHFKVSIPANVKAMLFCPILNKSNPRIMESGAVVLQDHVPQATAPGLEFLRIENNFAVFNAGSGDYDFVVR
jgi:alpha-L-rhamnosidase